MAFTKPTAAQINFDITNISDPLICLNYGQSGTPDDDVGIVIERGSGTNVALIWDESADLFALINTTETGTTAGNVTIASYAGLAAGAITATGTSTSALLTLTTTEASASASPVIVLKRNSGSPADSDSLGQIKFLGENDADEEVEYGRITATIFDASNGSEDGKMQVKLMEAGTLTNAVRFESDTLFLNTGNTITFEGATADNFETILTVVDPTGDRTVSLPNITGTVITTGDTGTVSGTMVADNAIDSDHYTDGSIDNAHIADDAIDSEHYAAGSIDSAHLADDAVTLAKMAAGTDGNLISYDTSGNPVAVATGSDGQVLTSSGSGTVCAFEDAAGGGATIAQDNSTNTAFNLYYAATTSGTLTALKYDGADMTFNPSTSTLVCTNITGTASAAEYADLAEMYAADKSYEPGTVLVLGGESEVTSCKEKADPRVLGIVSSNPAYLMNSALDTEHVVPVALTGRVFGKVIGKVSKGDLMVTSEVEGYAESWHDISFLPAGSILGKAVEGKTGASEGIIEIVVGTS